MQISEAEAMEKDQGPELVDRVIGNPAFEHLGGYHIFFRRAAIPIFLILIGLLTYSIVDGFLSHQSSLMASAIMVGLSLGPILNMERYLGMIMSRK
ncbi:MAG: hypothetical protein CMA79_01685 [Euryarchaeota archaeon]|nr:hypothetical protein [Euryarchaeota archaeon]MBN55134.1 hypothetical protein [Euryarchaeota archaeon]